MEKKQRFSLRKYKSGTFSVLIGSVFLMMTTTVAADELTTMSEPTITNHAQQQAQRLTNTELSSAESESQDTSQITPKTNREKEQPQGLVSEPTTTELADTDSAPMANTGPDATQKKRFFTASQYRCSRLGKNQRSLGQGIQRTRQGCRSY